MGYALPFGLMFAVLIATAFSWTKGIDRNKDLSEDEINAMRDSF